MIFPYHQLKTVNIEFMKTKANRNTHRPYHRHIYLVGFGNAWKHKSF